jgi:hypothetical protein
MVKMVPETQGEVASDLETAIEALKALNPSREISIVITKLEECIFWLCKIHPNVEKYKEERT